MDSRVGGSGLIYAPRHVFWDFLSCNMPAESAVRGQFMPRGMFFKTFFFETCLPIGCHQFTAACFGEDFLKKHAIDTLLACSTQFSAHKHATFVK